MCKMDEVSTTLFWKKPMQIKLTLSEGTKCVKLLLIASRSSYIKCQPFKCGGVSLWKIIKSRVTFNS